MESNQRRVTRALVLKAACMNNFNHELREKIGQL